jgi:hypothetical protein
MNSNGIATDLQFAYQSGEKAMTIKKMIAKMIAKKITKLIKKLIINMMIKIQLLGKTGSVRCLNEDEFKEFDKCADMFSSALSLVDADEKLILEKAEIFGHVASLAHMFGSVLNLTGAKENLLFEKAENIGHVAFLLRDFKELRAGRPALRAGLPAVRKEAFVDETDFIKHLGSIQQSNDRLNAVAADRTQSSRKAAETRWGDDDVSRQVVLSPTTACFQITNPYLV